MLINTITYLVTFCDSSGKKWVALVVCRKQDETGYGEQRRHAEVHGHVPVSGSERC